MSEESKAWSRKFVVWVTWLVIILITALIMVVDLFVLRNIPESIISAFLKLMEYFFIISMLYLGVNLGQKGIYAVKDIKANSNVSTETEEVADDKDKEFSEQ